MRWNDWGSRGIRWWCFGAIKYCQFLAQHLNLPRFHFRIDCSIIPGSHLTPYIQYELISYLISKRKTYLGIRIEDDLDDPVMISHIKKNDAAVISTAMDPTIQGNLITNMRFPELATIVAPHY